MEIIQILTKRTFYYWLYCLGRIILAMAIGFYCWQSILNPRNWHLLDGANLAIHETGHLFTRYASPIVQMSAGTIAQLSIPLLLIIYFLVIRKRYSAFIIMFWLGQSLANVSVYAGDAISQSLPLLGGPNSIHDWNFILTHFGLLAKTEMISRSFWWSGAILASIASIGALLTARQEEKDYF